jgi:HAMP domain-containing protein
MQASDTIRPRKAHLPLWRQLSWRLGASFLLLTAIGILLSGFLQYRTQDQYLRQSLGTMLLNIARTGALFVEPPLHAEVEATLTRDSDAYRRLHATLAAIQNANRLDTPIYTLTGFDATRHLVHFMVTSGGEGEGDPGAPYALVPALLEPLSRAFREGGATHTDVYENQHGTWITAFAPIRHASGQVVAVLDVDYRVEVYLAERAAVRQQFSLHALAGALLALLAGVLMARRITQPITQLTALSRRIVEGDLSARMPLAARDEIGLLANVFHLMVERLHVSHRSIVDVLVRALEARGGEGGALRRKAAVALAVADRLEVSPTQREALELGALLHNIGEVRIPDALLHKSEPLTPDEGRLVEQHPAWGVEILETVPLLTPALDVVGGHHERFDGTGYPQGLRGEEIPLTARIFAVADALDCLMHDQSARSAGRLSDALDALRRGAGTQFDPRIVEAILLISEDCWAALLGGQTPEAAGAQQGHE